jgi:hypothetical protein
VGDTGEEEGRK